MFSLVILLYSRTEHTIVEAQYLSNGLLVMTVSRFRCLMKCSITLEAKKLGLAVSLHSALCTHRRLVKCNNSRLTVTEDRYNKLKSLSPTVQERTVQTILEYNKILNQLVYRLC